MGGRRWIILWRGYKIMLILDLKKEGLLEKSLKAVLINN
jgi:hypothetical protein